MRARFLLLTASLCSLGAPTARAAVLWQGDFEGGDLSEWDAGALNETKGDRQNIVIVADPTRVGNAACQITIHEDDTFEPFNQNRVEIAHDGLRTAEGQDTYVAWFVLLPADAQIRNNVAYWESNASFQNMMTFWVQPDAGGTSIHFGTGFLGQDEHWGQPLTLGEWHRIAMHVHWSEDALQGSVSVWFDGELVVNAVEAKTKADTNTLFLQMGLHRPDPAPFTETLYIDGAIEADSLDDVLAAVPAPEMPDAGVGGSAGSAGAGGAPVTAGSGGGLPVTGGAGGSGGVVPVDAGVADAAGGQSSPRAAAAAPGAGGCSLGARSGGSLGALLSALVGSWLVRAGRRRRSRMNAGQGEKR